MSRKRSKWKFSPARRHRPVGRISEDSRETGVVSEIEESLEEELPEESAAAIELPDYYFDEEDEIPEEDDLPEEDELPEESLHEAESSLPEENSFLEEESLSEEAKPESTGFTEADRLADDDIFVDEGPEADVEEFLDDDIDDPDNELDDLDDELDGLDDEPPLSIYERGGQGKKDAKKKGSNKNKKEKKQSVEKRVVRIGDLVVGDGVPKVCVPITGRNKDQIVEQAKEIVQAAPDLVEWRVDYLEEAGGKKDIIDILIAIRRVIGDTPLLFTYRTESEGGYGRVGWGHYAELLEWAACRPEIDIIDVEAMGLDVDTEGLIRIIHGRGTPVIASVHYCGEMPGKKERKEALRFLKQSGGDMIKMAFTPQTEEDVLELMAWTRRKSQKMEQPLITMAMGEVGRLSRVSGRLTGSAITFGSVGEASAAGQIPAGELKNILDQL